MCFCLTPLSKESLLSHLLTENPDYNLAASVQTFKAAVGIFLTIK